MNERKLDKKQIIFGVLGVILIIALIICFVIAYRNRDTLVSSGSSASDISSKYDDIDYGATSDLESTTITTGGSYNLTGTYNQITINTTKDVELNLTDVTITCDNGPAINVIEAGTVSIVLNGTNKISSTTVADLDGAIYSKADLIFSGDGSLEVTSNYDGIVSKDTLVIKSGTYKITADDDGIRGKDNVAITGGTFDIIAGGDGIKSTNEEDTSKGYVAIDGGTFTINSVTDAIQAETNIVINGGTFNIKTTGNASAVSAKGIKAVSLIEINSGTFNINTTDDGIHSDGNITINNGEITINSKDDAIHADGMLEINNGTINLTAAEGLEATYVKINDGDITISATDDGINAGNKSNSYSVTIEINGGNIKITMGSGDTDGIDSNGNLYINGGTINIIGSNAFDYDGEAKYTGGTIIVNGVTTNTITNQMMGGNMGGEPNGGGNQSRGRRSW